ncbi:hypothetical protein HanRHA438_Chr15g0716691 [Helianthus annuus]|uniref:Uncharacterized protein n=1 Tax=Helianthus annuus TaxID=4232 RepID=A0A9K3E3P3_HELAN|nr:hypothetical protein HanXRQr2_Chr15g0704321 [Helianthus annuus]KAJ0452020.1 hypothetical protein HanHA300_Chr15g0574181 [Helianthus annuus]KAJ0456753.1 hypothetical protein HanIR_Chr15g0766011 [Helianthus annuus]KAJ0832192.1 hypothetical protein HanPSC8_Chr15g0675911 [Helianthus annuus]KAJ0845708.1 hypothetical protein HanRHA438_Chr15g0716691 [Helianthus annuus]
MWEERRKGLAPAVVRRPKPEPRDTADIPPSNPNDPIDLESSPERLLRKKAGKRKQTGVDADGQPAKKVQKKITRRGNLDAFIAKLFLIEKPNSPVSVEPSFVVNEELPPSPSRTPANELLGSTEVIDHEVGRTAGKSADVAVDAVNITSSEAVDVGTGNPQTLEFVAQDSGKEKSAQEIPVTMSPFAASGFVPENVEKNPGGNQGSFIRSNENSHIRADETLGDYYYRCYSEKQADEVHMPVWKLKKGDTFSDWHVCREWLQGTFPPGEIKFQEGRPHEQTYRSYLEEAASYTSTSTVYSLSKKKAAEDEARATQLRAKLQADQAKFENDRKTEEWSVAGWKRKTEAEAALLTKERKNWKETCEKDNAEKMGLRNVITNLKAEFEKLKKQDAEIESFKNEKADVEAARDEARSHRERSEQREEQLKAEAEAAKKDLELALAEKAETSRRLAETEEKLETSETVRATTESELEPLKGDMLWLKERGIASC